MHLKLDNENIYYKEEGKAEKIFVMIHNAGGNHKFFQEQIKIFSNIGKVFAIDLPGHGLTSAMDKQYSILKYAKIIIKFIKKLNLNNICLIGLNNGANIGIEIINNNGDEFIDELILIDPPLFMKENFILEIEEFIDKLNAPNIEHFIEDLTSLLFIKAPNDIKLIAKQSFKSVSVRILISIFKDLINWNKNCNEKLLAINIPTLCIVTDEHHCSYNKINNLNNNFEIGKVVGSKCWATLEVPEQINAMILRFLELQNLLISHILKKQK
ncbi:alpha/beta fold hydrolase [Rickettsiales endosymbiont of Trichoplax sp. H2]|uniref:alpha/beta fold hydrolase n=1 Tax=Rickettsiales endosymbiont of Trichoplax sp. H2 TaxID=2021221 RepID=UPI0012B28B84|nr:alpha/beta hydrolase [Rickettsiales endosymbiont of Trichoplax sp. H2]MSO13436.1 AB hydrolase superfamily protein YdjP [Rickettsiales endosymbiont of Trichoplax sp. H2]